MTLHEFFKLKPQQGTLPFLIFGILMMNFSWGMAAWYYSEGQILKASLFCIGVAFYCLMIIIRIYIDNCEICELIKIEKYGYED